MLATIGGLIKDYRIKRRLSQLELSLKIGWSDSTRLSRIEQERAGTPSRETLDKIINALTLTNQERGEFLYTGGYLPTQHEINTTVKYFQNKILHWKYPAYILDFSWNMLYLNQATIDTFHFPQEFLSNTSTKHINLLDCIIYPLDVDVWKGDDANTLRPLSHTLISQFKAEHLGQENQKWYKQLVTKYSRNKTFFELWNRYTANDHHKKLRQYEYKLVKDKKENESRYHIFDSELISDPRFTLTTYLPA